MPFVKRNFLNFLVGASFSIWCIYCASAYDKDKETKLGHIPSDDGSCVPATADDEKKYQAIFSPSSSRKKRDVQCPSSGGSWSAFMNNCYMIVKGPVDQPTAELSCRNNGGHLPSIGSAAENGFIQNLASGVGASSVWIGLRYEAGNGWKWLNQIAYTYNNWSTAQPNDPSNLRCVIMNSQSSGQWETRQCYPATADGYPCMTVPAAGSSDACQPNPCLNNGYCQNANGGYSCVCRTGFGGPTCAISSAPSACASNPCKNGGTCMDGGSYYQCSCASGYSGVNCDQGVVVQSGTANGTCSVGACSNGGTCTSKPGSAFVCTCPPGYAGTRCEINNNECASNPCSNGATCVDGLNEYVCKCADGWSGSTCTQRLANCNPNPCKHNGVCVTLSVTEFICKCADGYVGEQCENDVNECDYGICSTGATCMNTPGSFYCLCQSGTTSVTCPSKTATGTGTGGTNSNGCSNNPCLNGGACTSQAGNGFSCACTSGYSGSTCGTASGMQNACASKPCTNGGVCALSGNQYSCTCSNGYSGQNCQYGSGSNSQSTSTTVCNPNPCQNGGTCSAGQNGGYACQCAKGYTGSTCAIPCPSGWSWSTGVCYQTEYVSNNYEQAAAMCPRQQAGSFLLTVESQTEFDNAAILMNQLQSDVWMGLKYDVSRAQFVWVTGAALGVNDFKAWAPQQPSNPQTKNCARITANAGFVWITEDCSRSLKFICKYKG